MTDTGRTRGSAARRVRRARSLESSDCLLTLPCVGLTPEGRPALQAAGHVDHYTGVLGAVDVFTTATAFTILESIRLDLGYRMDVQP